MRITVSGKQTEVPAGTTVSQLISEEHVEMPDYVTVSVNEAFVDRPDFATTQLKEGDVVELLYFMGGGAR